MRRRKFLATIVGAAAAWPAAAWAQRPRPVVGYLSGRSLASDAHLVKALRSGLAEAGYVDGRNVELMFHWAEGHPDRLSDLADDLIAHGVAVIFAGGVDVGIRALHAKSVKIPFVFATGGDPVDLGIAASLARPGGNATGATVLTAALWPKRLELLRELVNRPAVVAVLVDPNNATAKDSTRDVGAAAREIGQQVAVVSARSEAEFESAFAAISRERATALLVPDDPLFINSRAKLVALAAVHAVPAIYGRREFPVSGGLMSYGASAVDQYRQSGIYAGRILAGAKAGDLPFLQPTRFELVFNSKTASALGIEIPPKLLAVADEVIE